MADRTEEFIYGEPLGPRVTEVSPIADYKLVLRFDNGEKRMFDTKPLLFLDVFKPLKNENIFSTVKVAYGTVFWEEGIDYCPDTLYSESVPID